MIDRGASGSPLAVEDHCLLRPDGVSLHLRSWRPADGSCLGVIVLVHGLGEHAGRYEGWAGELAGLGFLVAAYDQRGHGRSPGPRGVLADLRPLLDDLEAVGEWTRGLVDAGLPTIVYGHSFGGLVALRAVQGGTFPWSGLILSAPWLSTAVEVPWWKRALAGLLVHVAPRLTLTSGLDPSDLSRRPDVVESYGADPLVHDRVSAGLVAVVETAQSEATGAGLPDGLPCLVLLPLEDRIADPEATRRWADTHDGDAIEVELLEGGRHEPHNDQDAARVFARVREWLPGGGV